MPYSAVTLLTGPTGSGKTTLLGTAAEWLWKKHKKVLRLYTADGGGFGTKMQALIEAGIVEVWRMRTRCAGGREGLIEETCMRASQGYWPKTFTDPVRGETASGVELAPPVTTMYTMLCPAGHTVKAATVRAAAATPGSCPTCKVMVTLTNCTLQMEEWQTAGFEMVGAVAIEGLTSLSDWIMISLADRMGPNETQGEKAALSNIRSGDMTFGSNNRAHYGFAQNHAEKWLLNSTAIPNLILGPIWTGLEMRVETEGGQVTLPFYGPAIAGQAKTGKVPQWVGNYMGAQGVINEKGNKEWRLYLSEYRDHDGYPHYYKVRTDPGVLPQYLADVPGGKPLENFNLGVFFELLEEATKKSLNETKEQFPDAPGTVPSGLRPR